MPRTARARLIGSRLTRASVRFSSVVLAAGVATAALAGCGSTTGPAGANADATATAVDQNPSALLPPTGAASAAPQPSAAATAASTAGNTPGVTGATDLTKAPVLAAGTGTGPTALVTKDLVTGTGAVAALGNTVDVRYVATVYSTGKVFDASWTRSPTDTAFPLTVASPTSNGVIAGFADGIAGMRIGGRREIVIPAALGYGPEGGNPSAGISATDTIVFVVDLLKVSAS